MNGPAVFGPDGGSDAVEGGPGQMGVVAGLLWGNAVGRRGRPQVGEEGGGALEVLVGDKPAAAASGCGDGLEEGASVREVVHGGSSAGAGWVWARTVLGQVVAGGVVVATPGRWFRGIPRIPCRAGLPNARVRA